MKLLPHPLVRGPHTGSSLAALRKCGITEEGLPNGDLICWLEDYYGRDYLYYLPGGGDKVMYCISGDGLITPANLDKLRMKAWEE